MSIIPNNNNPFGDTPFSAAISTTIPELSGDNLSFLSSQVDWKETPEAHVFKADISGMNKEEVKVEVEDGRVLQISGERKMEKQNLNDTSQRVECSRGKFMRSFTLPTNAKMDQVKATMDNGILTVTVPKQPEAKAIENSY